MDPFATVEDLQLRLDWELSDDELRIAEAALEDASDLARFYGRDWEDEIHAPRQVRTIVLRAVQRYMRNPDGYIQSRAGDETVIWSDTRQSGGTPEFTDDEIKILTALAGKSQGFGSVPVSAWGPQRRRGCRSTEGYVPVAGSTEKPFPLYESDTSPWIDPPWDGYGRWCP